MDFRTIRFSVLDGLATVALDRPDKLNALNPLMLDELIAAFDAIDADDSVRAAIVTGSGRGFCAGSDVQPGSGSLDFANRPDSPIRADGSLDYSMAGARDGGGRLALRIFACLKPVIAAINGAAVGVGATMTLPMDIRIASETARFGFVFVRRGIVPEACSSYFLPRVVGIGRALEWCLSGRVFSAVEALEAGLVRSVHPPDQLLPTAYAIAREIADNAAPVSVALTRQMLWRGLGMEHPMDAHRIDSRAILARSRSADMAEGIRSFLEKRPPRFTDTVAKDMPDFFPWWDEPGYK